MTHAAIPELRPIPPSGAGAPATLPAVHADVSSLDSPPASSGAGGLSRVEQIRRIRALDAQGLSSSEIAARLQLRWTRVADIVDRAERYAVTKQESGPKPKPAPPPLFWTPERDAALRLMVLAGKTITDMAAALGCTRGAVGGRIDRNGLRVAFSPSRGQPESPLAILPPRKVVHIPVVYSHPRKCLFIEGGPPFVVGGEIVNCGDPTIEGRPYCAPHAARAYRRVSKEERL